MEEKKELWIKTLLFFPFRIIGHLLSALAMDDKGFSLKKCLAVIGTIEAVRVTENNACKENAIAFLIVWLIWVGILVGIYSLGDISSAFSKIKGTTPPNGGITSSNNDEKI